MKDLLLLIPLLPLAGFLVNGLGGRRFSKTAVHWIACLSTGVSFLLAVLVFIRFTGQSERWLEFHYFSWIRSGSFSADFALLLDPLSMVMVLTVTGVGFLIHIYSIGYMWNEGGYARFFCYLNLFMAAMLILVLGNNLLLLFVGWEGVGLCSYLLIGFYFHKDSAAGAGKKAFIVNRIGDFGFITGVLVIFAYFGTLEFKQLFGKVALLPAETGAGILTVVSLLLFAGATGKSAQIPLYVWLPDAMEGPTPVSALIHAATMVTAGVYMVVRTNPVFSRSPEALFWMGLTGAVTALFAATIGLFQRDIKRVLAYSTVSQLGYMFTALGVMAFSSGILHLVTHAFFKALLFLGSGSVILALHHEQDMQNMGGLRKYLPVTFYAMWGGTLAIAGFPFFSGFFSKDEILWSAFSFNGRGGMLFYLMGTAGAVITAFYMVRMMILTFSGPRRSAAEDQFHDSAAAVRTGHGPHTIREGSAAIKTVLICLAILSVAGGFIGMPAWMGPNILHQFLEPVFNRLPAAAAGPAHSSSTGHLQEIVITTVSVLAGITGILLALWLYRSKKLLPAGEEKLGGLYRLIFRKYYIDELYQAVIIRPLYRISESLLWKAVDQHAIDGTVNFFGSAARAMSGPVSRMQNGFLRAYLGWILAGILALGLAVLISLT